MLLLSAYDKRSEVWLRDSELDLWERANNMSMQLAFLPMETAESQIVCYEEGECPV